MQFSIHQEGRERVIYVMGEAIATLRDISHSCPLDVIELRASGYVRMRARGGQIIENVSNYPFDCSPLSAVPEAILKSMEWKDIICTDSDVYSPASVLKRLQRLVTSRVSPTLAAKVHLLAARIHMAEAVYAAAGCKSRDRLKQIRVLERYAKYVLYLDGLPNRYAMALLYAHGYRTHAHPNGDIEFVTNIQSITVAKPAVSVEQK